VSERRSLPWWWTAGLALLRRPDLWATALGQVRALAPERWWARFPPIPSPDRAWLAFRMETAYGDAHARPDAHDVVAFLEWCQQTPRTPHRVR
jgi:hypothetical protein